MKKNENLPQPEEMRQIIKNILTISYKLGGSVPISNLDAAATFAVYLYGFSSWKQYKSSLNKELKKNIFYSNAPTKIPASQIIAYEIDKKNSYYIEKIKEIPIANKDSKDLPLEWLIGKHKSHKIEEPRGLMPKNTFLIGSPTCGLNNLYNSQIEWLVKNYQAVTIFSSEEKSKIFFNNLKLKESILIIGKNYIRLNPLNEILNSTIAKDFFETNNNEFNYIWLKIIKKLRHSYVLKIEDLLRLLELKGLLSLYIFWEHEEHEEHEEQSILKNYLFETCVIEEKSDMFNVSISSTKKHLELSLQLNKKIKEIKELYDNNFFTEEASISFKELILNKKSSIVVNEHNELYKSLLCNAYLAAHKHHNNILKNINSNHYNYWTIWWEAENWISENNSDLFNQVKEASIMNYYVQSSFEGLSSILNNIEQIVFLQQNLKGYTQEWKNKMLSQTSIQEVNFWYDNSHILKELNYGEALLWQTINENCHIKLLEDYRMEKIKLYDF